MMAAPAERQFDPDEGRLRGLAGFTGEAILARLRVTVKPSRHFYFCLLEICDE
jgi:hypothetical protein